MNWIEPFISISPFISNCTNLQSLDLSNNSLTGPIPTELQYLVNLAVLKLSSNHISGRIPLSIAMCVCLNVIDLHDNDLNRMIPAQVGSLVRLLVFDVSNNKLSGPIAVSLGNRTGQMKNKRLSVVAIVVIRAPGAVRYNITESNYNA
ncbi:putative non-specific serine/threonine protein kinase [Helianthus debilis subsp. tardiflorus]